MTDIISQHPTIDTLNPVEAIGGHRALRRAVDRLRVASLSATARTGIIVETAKAGVARIIGIEPVLPEPTASERLSHVLRR